MATIKLNASGSVVLKNGKPSCACCCADEWIVVDFAGSGTGGYVSGSICADGFGWYPCWCESGIYDGVSNRHHIETNVGMARCDGVWTSSVNFTVKAHWDRLCEDYIEGTDRCDPLESSDGTLSVTYKGATKTASMTLIHAERGSSCTAEDVGLTVTVYAAALGDGSYFEIT